MRKRLPKGLCMYVLAPRNGKGNPVERCHAEAEEGEHLCTEHREKVDAFIAKHRERDSLLGVDK